MESSPARAVLKTAVWVTNLTCYHNGDSPFCEKTSKLIWGAGCCALRPRFSSNAKLPCDGTENERNIALRLFIMLI